MLIVDSSELDSVQELLQDVEPCKILIIDSVDTDRFLLKKILENLNYKIIPFKLTDDIHEVIQHEKPELVFYNVEASLAVDEHLLKGIKQCQKEEGLVPHIILTISNETSLKVESTDQNEFYDDICRKPYSENIINSKLNNWKKITSMQQLLDMQEARLSEYSNQIGQEMEMAANIINNLSRDGGLSPENVKYVQFPMEVLSGDIFLSTTNPTGSQVFLVGDLTGHGLAAAVGAMVVYDVFYSMVKKGFHLEKIVLEINSKLRRVQNPGRFMCACLIELDNSNQFMHIVNAGLPSVLVKGKKTGIKDHFKSNNIPLGVISSSELEVKIIRVELEQGDRIYVYTDGLNEVHNKDGEFLGNERIQKLFYDEQAGTDLYDAILNLMNQFHDGGRRTDDITLAEIICDKDLINTDAALESRQVKKPPMHWSFALDIGVDVIRRENPIPLLLQIANELQGMQEHREHIFTVLSEMFSNALEHGLLGLSSEIKKDVDGFARYYNMRERQLEKLQQGNIRLEMKNVASDNGGKLTFALQHDGEDFDFASKLNKLDKDGSQAYGRGIKLIQNICQDIRYSDKGRRMEADYFWEE